MTTNVQPCLTCSALRLQMTSCAIAESRPLVGSSRNMHRGEHRSAHATAVRFISPPLTPRISLLPMYVLAQRCRLSCAMTSATLACFSAGSPGGSLAMAANRIVSDTVAPPKKQSCCWM